MRQIVSSGSAKGIFLKRNEILKKLKEISKIAIKKFPEIKDIRVFGSFAKKEETGLSDIDILIISEFENKSHLEVAKKYFNFFQEKINMGIDLILIKKEEIGKFKESYSLIKSKNKKRRQNERRL
ncbi:MAG: nucleotidyltransferase domain-containing protein [Candidatus Ratteibacteria bacterium]